MDVQLRRIRVTLECDRTAGLDCELLDYNVLQCEIVIATLKSVCAIHLQIVVGRPVIHAQMPAAICPDSVATHRIHHQVNLGFRGHTHLERQVIVRRLTAFSRIIAGAEPVHQIHRRVALQRKRIRKLGFNAVLVAECQE